MNVAAMSLERYCLIIPQRKARKIKIVCFFGAFSLSLVSLFILNSGKPVVKSTTLEIVEADVNLEGQVAYQNKWVGFPQLKDVNCREALTKSMKNSLYPKALTRTSATELAMGSKDCPSFLTKHGFHRNPQPTQEERAFPLAYIILFHKDLDQVLFLLRAIYQPHNVYCLSVDLNAGPHFINAAKVVAKCFQNVFVAQKLEPIVYAAFSRFIADVHCMRELVKHPVKWKYLHNLPGQQFPLRTNLELVKILKIYNGASDFLGSTDKRSLHRRYKIKHHLIKDKKTGKYVVEEAVERNEPPPHNFKVVKGSAYGTFSRTFVEFVLMDKRVADLIQWSKDIESPDEYVFPTLHFTKVMKVPGGYQGAPEGKRYLASFSAWENEVPCASMFVRWICIFSTADLPMLMGRPELFANKFYIDHHPTALHCLDQYLFNLTISRTVRNLQFYRDIPWVGNDRR